MLTWEQVRNQIANQGWTAYAISDIYSLWYSTFDHIPPPPNPAIGPTTTIHQLYVLISSYYP